MPRSIWKGAISFGLITIPIKVYGATETKDLSFRQVHPADGGRIKYKRVCEVCGKEIPYTEIAKGYETGDGRMVILEAEDFDTLAGVIRGARQLNHEEVLRLRQANPHESLEVLAMRLGCSLSTIKRHMRRARNAAGEVKLAAVEPTMERVLAAFAAVVRPNRSRERRVA